MQREPRAYLADILESCDEFTIIGEAVLALSHKAPDIFESITNARRIVDFRNRLTHEYATIDDELVWALAKADLAVLGRECAALFSQLDSADKHQDPADGTMDAC